MRRIVAVALPLGLAACMVPQGPPPPGQLLLTNRGLAAQRVEAVITANFECEARGPGFVGTADFVLPPGGTRIIDAPPGADVCWRYERKPPPLGWDRAFLAPGRTVDSNL